MDIENPIDSDADGQVDDFAAYNTNRTGNAFDYDRGTTNKCVIPCRVQIQPDTAEDGQPGAADNDDDGDEVKDERNDMSEIGYVGSDDSDLDADDDDVPDSWEPYHIEDEAAAAETVSEDTYAGNDWGHPGKQHATLSYED